MRSWTRSSVALIAAGVVLHANAVLADRQSENEARQKRAKLVEKPLAQLSDTNLSARAQIALRSVDHKWRHGETDHFIYHFQRITEASRLAREAEFFYWKIKDDLRVTGDVLKTKSHIFLMSRKDRWEIFVADARAPYWSVGFAAGRELFMLAEAGDTDISDLLAHELTHLVFFRFVPRQPPLWLHEGFAEYESKAAYARLKGIGMSRQRGKNEVAPLDVAQLTGIDAYPSEPAEVYQFYRESERLARFLVTEHDPKQFVPLVNLLADGRTFEQALLETYGSKYRSLDEFKKRYQRFQ